jgi:hypothetical protein
VNKVIERKEIFGLNLGSHTVLDARLGHRSQGLNNMINVTKQRTRIYPKNPTVGIPGEGMEDLPSVVESESVIVEASRDIKKIVA